ncbi:galactan beta-1,4-galactosyltransferase GALS1-like [Hordeum vulgare subsp. vulgare]|uniref:Glycosyltransferase family 92 protein n=1 Tax=Hordeum vulgare subsp. vulgare TaxID=112509 RepID=A0A8I7BCA6_HORVV|nr:galactan beta-1,4-galactosyltransferase GALS1-like [Hordeum vulgare subsp. vulgare]
MKKKDAGGGGGGGGAFVAVPCVDMKLFVASLAFLTLFVALWQLQPYGTLLAAARSSASAPPCALPLATTSAAGIRISNNNTEVHSANSTSSDTATKSTPGTTSAPDTPAVGTVPMRLARPATRPEDPNKPVLTRPHESAAARTEDPTKPVLTRPHESAAAHAKEPNKPVFLRPHVSAVARAEEPKRPVPRPSGNAVARVEKPKRLVPRPSGNAAVRPDDPNKRVLRPYGSAAALFVQMGAYRGGPRTFAVVGLASKPTHVFGTPYFKCEWQPNPSAADPAPRTVRTKAYKILPDWGYGRVYTTVVVNCTFPANPNAANAGGKLLVHAYYSTASRRYERFVALEEAPGSYDESIFSPPFQHDYLYCGSSLYGNLSASRMREWMAYHAHFFGPRSHFVFHDAGGVSPEVRAVLDPWIRAGRVTVQDIRAQAEFDSYYYNQFLVVNDCLHRYRHAANWTFFFDVDEYLYLPDGQALDQVLAKLSGYTQFTIEQNPMSTKLCVKNPRNDYSREWGFEKFVFRNSITRVRRDRKYAIQARNAYATGVHMSQNVYGRSTHKTETLIRYYHYHNSINVLGEPCQEFVPRPGRGRKVMFEGVPYVYDDTMKRLAGEIRRFENETIGSLSHT